MSLQLTGRINKRKGFADINEDAIHIESEEADSKIRRINESDSDDELNGQASLSVLDKGHVNDNDAGSLTGPTPYRNVRWEHMFSILIEWGLQFGTCNVSRTAVAALDDGSEVFLGEWLKRQKSSKRKGELPHERLILLQKLVDGGYMDWDKVIPTPLVTTEGSSSVSIPSSVVGAGVDVEMCRNNDAHSGGSNVLVQRQDQESWVAAEDNDAHGVEISAVVSALPLLDPLVILSDGPAHPLLDVGGTNDDILSLAELLVRVRKYLKACTCTSLSSFRPNGAVALPADQRNDISFGGNVVTSVTYRDSTSSSVVVQQSEPTVDANNTTDKHDKLSAGNTAAGIGNSSAATATGEVSSVGRQLDSETAILHSIATFPVPGSFRRVIESKLHLKCFGVSVIPSMTDDAAVALYAGGAGQSGTGEYKYKKFWYCCAGRKCTVRRFAYDITDNCQSASKHLRKVHNVFVADLESILPSVFPALWSSIRSPGNVTISSSSSISSTVTTNLCGVDADAASNAVIGVGTAILSDDTGSGVVDTESASDSDDDILPRTAPGIVPGTASGMTALSHISGASVSASECQWLAVAETAVGCALSLHRALAECSLHFRELQAVCASSGTNTNSGDSNSGSARLQPGRLQQSLDRTRANLLLSQLTKCLKKIGEEVNKQQ